MSLFRELLIQKEKLENSESVEEVNENSEVESDSKS